MWDDSDDPVRAAQLAAAHTNRVQAADLGFKDLSPIGFWGTDLGEHVAVCSRCASLVHYPLPVSEAWPPLPQYVKSTESLRRHLRSVHGTKETPGE